MNNKLKTWICKYDWYSRGAIQQYGYVCIAETKEDALKLAIEDSGELYYKECWEVTEISTDSSKAYYVHSYCN